jgi:hypothetical protein
MNTSTADSPPKPGRLNRLFAEYGMVAIAVYYGIFFSVLVSFAWAIDRGFADVIYAWTAKVAAFFHWGSSDGSSVGTALGTWGAAYVATKLTQPLRIVATLLLTPLLATLIRRFVKKPPAEPPEPPAPLV